MKKGNSDKNKLHTLSDSDIVSKRRMSRRTLLGALGIGLGVAATAVAGARPAEARRICNQDPFDRCYDRSDSDPYDRPEDPHDLP